MLTSDYLLLARTKGLTRAQTTVRHALRNAMVPIFPMILGEFVGIMSGSIIIEQIFGIPGRGPAVRGLDHRGHAGLQLLYAACPPSTR